MVLFAAILPLEPIAIDRLGEVDRRGVVGRQNLIGVALS